MLSSRERERERLTTQRGGYSPITMPLGTNPIVQYYSGKCCCFCEWVLLHNKHFRCGKRKGLLGRNDRNIISSNIPADCKNVNQFNLAVLLLPSARFAVNVAAVAHTLEPFVDGQGSS